MWRQWLDYSLSAGADVYDALGVVEGAGECALEDLDGLGLVEVLGRCQRRCERVVVQRKWTRTRWRGGSCG